MSGKALKITVVTAVYNRVDTIVQAVESVLSQGYQDIEYVVQDGGSNDGTLEKLRRIDDPRLSLVSEPDEGIYDAINKGVARASGDVIGLMHSDDFFAHHCVLQTVAEAFDNLEIDGVYGDLDYVATDNPDRIIRRWRSGSYTSGKLRRGWMPPHPTLYMRRSVFDRWGAYDARLCISADYDAILRWLNIGQLRLAYIPDVFVKMRVGGESNRSLSRILRKSREDYTALRRNKVGGIGTLAWKNLSKVRQFL